VASQQVSGLIEFPAQTLKPVPFAAEAGWLGFVVCDPFRPPAGAARRMREKDGVGGGSRTAGPLRQAQGRLSTAPLAKDASGSAQDDRKDGVGGWVVGVRGLPPFSFAPPRRTRRGGSAKRMGHPAYPRSQKRDLGAPGEKGAPGAARAGLERFLHPGP
jgi:hypothetical protein